MITLTIRTDNPAAEIGLYDDARQLAYHTWRADRQLAETIHVQIRELLNSQKWTFGDLQGIVAYQGPGSFTGLRIGLSVVNALARAKNIPITTTGGEDWITQGLHRLQSGATDYPAMPRYGADPHITTPVK